MTSWEDVINQVVIPGDPGAVSSASAEWTVVFQRIREAKRYLDDGLVDLEAWEGEAGQTCTATRWAHRPEAGHARHREQRYHRAARHRRGGLHHGNQQHSHPGRDDPRRRQRPRGVSRQRTLSGFGPDFIYERMRGFYESGFLGAVASIPGVGSALTGLRNWITDNDEEAVRHYNALNGEYANVAAGIPAGSTPPGMIQPSFEPIPNTPLGTGGAPGGLPGTGSAGGVPGGGFDPPGTPGTLGGTGSIDPPGSTGLDDPGSSFTDPDLDTGTGLAGAGDGGISGASRVAAAAAVLASAGAASPVPVWAVVALADSAPGPWAEPRASVR